MKPSPVFIEPETQKVIKAGILNFDLVWDNYCFGLNTWFSIFWKSTVIPLQLLQYFNYWLASGTKTMWLGLGTYVFQTCTFVTVTKILLNKLTFSKEMGEVIVSKKLKMSVITLVYSFLFWLALAKTGSCKQGPVQIWYHYFMSESVSISR